MAEFTGSVIGCDHASFHFAVDGITMGRSRPTTSTAPPTTHSTVRSRRPATRPTRRLQPEITRSRTISMTTIARPEFTAAPTFRVSRAPSTVCPSPGVSMSAATVIIDSAAITVWFTPTMRVRRDIGSCTPRSTCPAVAPNDRDASTDSGGTLRIPTEVSRITGGTA